MLLRYITSTLILPAILMLLSIISVVTFVNAADAQETVTGKSVGELIDNNLTPDAQNKLNEEMKEKGIDPDEAKKTTVSYNDEEQMITVTAPADTKLSDEHLFFLGARVGVILPFGMDATYLDIRDGKKNYHAVVGGTLSYDMKTIEAGAGWHPWGRAFYVGGRVKDVFEDGHQFFGVSPEVGWLKVWGKNRNVMGSIGIGATKAFGRYYNLPVMADIHFGIAVKIAEK